MNSQLKRTRWAGVVCNDEIVSVDTYSGHRSCSIDGLGKHLVAPKNLSDEELGNALIEALALSRFLSLPEVAEFHDLTKQKQRYEEWVKSLMEKGDYKTRRALFRNMKSCFVENQDDQIVIHPSHHRKLEAWSGEGITEQDWIRIKADCPPIHVGAAIHLAFGRCT